jgi:phospholipase C
MDSRRDFFKKAAMLAAGSGLAGGLPASIQKAFAIDPEPGSTYLDAEHVVILMQENRSFDHAFGMLRGVRGFNDPRALTLTDGNPVWLQSNAAGETYAPFRFDIKNTKVTWMGSLPHGWVDQADARNGGKHDGWLDAKACSEKAYAKMPLTLGYYGREDIPFYYALADAFTICDQNFCSSLTATEPNRLHLWTGTVRAEPSIHSKAYVNNEDMGYYLPLDWTTFPERLEEHGVSWKIYQNEISLPTGLSDEADAWLSNFDDNPIEYFTKYRVHFSPTHLRYLAESEKSLAAELEQLKAQTQSRTADVEKKIAELSSQLQKLRQDLETWTESAFAQLPSHEQNLHRKAFTTNEGDPHYRELASLTYHDGTTEREMQIPKGDVLYQLREDVRTGKLPAVSWIVAPERFSDHPSSAWYGAWYISETLDILTQNPDVWKKTIFILCYDENDGYFDHVPPFVPPQPGRTDTGKVSAGIDPSVEYVSEAQHDERRRVEPDWKGKAGPIGLGFRVPLLIASPWSRGGYVCSQVFDHTSILQLLETFASRKTGQPIRETNISAWRRTVCGDLSSAFRPYHGDKITLPKPVDRDAFFSSIYEAQFKPVPDNFEKLSAQQIEHIRGNPHASSLLPRQEKGSRPACVLPYELAADGVLSENGKSFAIHLSANRDIFGQRAAGAPFRVYAPGKVPTAGSAAKFENFRAWDYAVSAGGRISDEWQLDDFDAGVYHLLLYGPNGFFREFQGTAEDPLLQAKLRPAHAQQTAVGNAELELTNNSNHPLTVVIDDLAYGSRQRAMKLSAAGESHAAETVAIDLSKSYGWHDLLLSVKGAPHFAQRFAGRIETGRESSSDPRLG